ncbi:MAG: bifunctional lysylphosphatidylglycerol flippase/synthetase MprF [Thermoanaerobaculaceae bacterium]|nr:bifunctional lysylphosphatidylglycerol flippase/synthetase MprF [Thermoanaerobaculaceae bacterium]
MRKTPLRAFAPLVGLALFAAALWVLHVELRHYSYHEVLREFRALPAQHIVLAALLAAASYVLLTGYDTLGLLYARHALPYRRTALASFVGHSFSNAVGLAMVSGGSVRLRLYSGWGLSTLAITKVIVFCGGTFWLGFMAVAGVVFAVEPLAIPAALHLPLGGVRPLGVLFLVAVAAVMIVSARRRRPFFVRGLEFPVPSPGLLAGQLLISALDWLAVGGVLYVLLAPGPRLSFAAFFGVYLLAQIAAVVSQVPGGLGVFEGVMVLLLAPAVPAGPALGALLAFRVVYYLVPLAAAAALLAAHELIGQREGVRRAARIFGRWAPSIVPHVLAITCFLGGAILLFSGATPTARWRLASLRSLIPLPLLELSHFVGSVAGAALLLLANGIQKRLDGAYLMAVSLLSVGVVVSLLKGLDFEEALALALMLAALLPSRRHFYRTASLTGEWMSPTWIAATALVLLASVWLGFFSYKHVEYSNDLWWRFAFSGDAPRFLRATVGALGVALLFAVARLLRPAPPQAARPGGDELAVVRTIVERSPRTQAKLALLGDKRFLFSEDGDAFIMYGVSGRSWVALGDPIGPAPAMSDLVWRFGELCDRHDDWPVFYEVGREHLHLYLDLGLTVMRVGEEARVRLDDFTLEGHDRKWLRHVHRRLEAEGCGFEVVARDGVPALLPELAAVSDSWLAAKGTREKGFSLGFFSPAYVSQFPAAVVRHGGRVVAFANVWTAAEREELSVDLMRFVRDAPNGVMEYMFVKLMLWGREQGYRWFNLGMAPLSGMQDHALAPLWMRLGALLYRHGENFYNFRGIRQYKDKFAPVWEPKYLASRGGLALPRIVTNVAALIAGSLRGVVLK